MLHHGAHPARIQMLQKAGLGAFGMLSRTEQQRTGGSAVSSVASAVSDSNFLGMMDLRPLLSMTSGRLLAGVIEVNSITLTLRSSLWEPCGHCALFQCILKLTVTPQPYALSQAEPVANHEQTTRVASHLLARPHLRAFDTRWHMRMRDEEG